MKKNKLVLWLVVLLPLTLLLTIESGCKKDDSNPTDSTNNGSTGSDNNNTGTDGNQSRNENWLLGTWEGITPGNLEAPLNNKKIRIVITAVKLKQEEHPVQNQTHRVYAYTGTFTWDADGSGWTMTFKEQNFPQPDYNVIIWGCTAMNPATIFIENISLRINDTSNVDTNHTIVLDAQMQMNSGSSITGIDFYGDIQIETNEGSSRAEFSTSNMLHLTKE